MGIGNEPSQFNFWEYLSLQYCPQGADIAMSIVLSHLFYLVKIPLVRC